MVFFVDLKFSAATHEPLPERCPGAPRASRESETCRRSRVRERGRAFNVRACREKPSPSAIRGRRRSNRRLAETSEQQLKAFEGDVADLGKLRETTFGLTATLGKLAARTKIVLAPVNSAARLLCLHCWSPPDIVDQRMGKRYRYPAGCSVRNFTGRMSWPNHLSFPGCHVGAVSRKQRWPPAQAPRACGRRCRVAARVRWKNC